MFVWGVSQHLPACEKINRGRGRERVNPHYGLLSGPRSLSCQKGWEMGFKRGATVDHLMYDDGERRWWGVIKCW